jgi:oligopeptide transport system substrate-binding protein
MQEFPIRLLVGSEGEQVCNRLFSLQGRFPKLFPHAIFNEVGHYLLNCPSLFLTSRSVLFLCNFIFSWYRLSKNVQLLGARRVYVRILEANSSLLGIAIALTTLKEHESFNEKHLLSGLQSLLSGIKLVPDSYLSYQDKKAHLFYLEVKKMKGGFFSSREKKRLSDELSFELEQRIESTPSLFLTENVEDLFKNIQHLSREVKYVHDLPQVMISFIEYSQNRLKFLVIVLRVIHPTTLAISSLSSHLPSLVHFSLETVVCVDKLRKKYPKEASVFTLEVNSSTFLRDNNEVNLRAARQYIFKALESMVGPFRDFNGGLADKENEQLSAIKSVLQKRTPSFSRFFEDLFYEIKPITMRVLISPQTGADLASLLQKVLDHPLLPEQKYYIDAFSSKETHIVIIKTTHNEWKTSLPQRILAHSVKTAYSHLENEGYLYLCFFHQHPKDNALSDLIRKELEEYRSQSPNSCNQVLQLNFQGGDPSSLNPRLSTDIRCHILSNLLFEGMTRINSSGKVELAAAEKIDLSPDGSHVTFHLRPSRWSNGEKLTAYHFEKAWKKAILENSIAFMRPNFFYPIKNATKVIQGIVSIDQVGIVAKDAKTLCVELESPCSHFLNLVATPFYFPLTGDSEEPTQFNGPFFLVEWQRDHHLYLSQNLYYWDALHVKLGGIKISMVRDAHTFCQMFQNGELDLIGDPISPLPPEILKRPEIQKHLLSKNISRIFWIHCNTQAYPLHNTDLRKALSLSLNRKKLTEKVFIKQTPHFSPLPPKYSSFDGAVEGDLQKAQAHFKLALGALKLDFEAFPSLVITHSDLSFERALIEELKMQWKEALGINVLSRELTWNEFSASLDQGDFQLAGLFRRDLLSHALSYLLFFKKSLNRSITWENEEFDKLLASPFLEKNIQEMERILIEEVPVIPLVNQKYFVMISERVKGIQWEENGCFNLRGAYFDEKNRPDDTYPFARYTSSLESK